MSVGKEELASLSHTRHSTAAAEYCRNKKCSDNINFVGHWDFSDCLWQGKASP